MQRTEVKIVFLAIVCGCFSSCAVHHQIDQGRFDIKRFNEKFEDKRVWINDSDLRSEPYEIRFARDTFFSSHDGLRFSPQPYSDIQLITYVNRWDGAWQGAQAGVLPGVAIGIYLGSRWGGAVPKQQFMREMAIGFLWMTGLAVGLVSCELIGAVTGYVIGSEQHYHVY